MENPIATRETLQIALRRGAFWLALCLASACGTERQACREFVPVVATWGDTGGTACSSYHASVTHMFAALARGDTSAAMYYLSVLSGLNVSQQQAIIDGLTHFFDEGNQAAKKCGDVARGGFKSLSSLGEVVGSRAYFLKIIATDAEILGFEVRNGTTKQVSDNGVHVAVKFMGRVFDAFTGPGGMEEAEYFRRLYTKLGQGYAKKEYAWYPGLFRSLD